MLLAARIAVVPDRALEQFITPVVELLPYSSGTLGGFRVCALQALVVLTEEGLQIAREWRAE
jgi:hypothetical protein